MAICLEKRKDKIMPGNYGSYSNKQKKIAKMSGNKKKMEASDFAKLRMFKKKKKASA